MQVHQHQNPIASIGTSPCPCLVWRQSFFISQAAEIRIWPCTYTRFSSDSPMMKERKKKGREEKEEEEGKMGERGGGGMS